ncbi:hypothetical protein COEREDRAFT_81510 [Coemansia reversa NRRL 1564]|uniref:Uncharacterized protein n=1 Tax=Coemansia reversa (strain ATCC 12441 / NRRL 1564) TaxID=763665 RepID=A0A2G5BAM4_COERN|nr:hypothetical protein COEREDRAFT_81510 [Coemansia reversa NRRL 1564]|eukprot:PIA16065.1 hypothetical protein COEREDRAFT_81510 [Coemansia reversa NRRL 1564]
MAGKSEKEVFWQVQLILMVTDGFDKLTFKTRKPHSWIIHVEDALKASGVNEDIWPKCITTLISTDVHEYWTTYRSNNDIEAYS